MNKDETIDALAQILAALLVVGLVAAGIKYAFNLTWFQSGMITYLFEALRIKKK
jgi:hypothetical protein